MGTNLALLRKARDYLAMDSRRRDMAKAVEAATDLLIKLSVSNPEVDAFVKAVKS